MGLPFVCLAAHGFRASSMARESNFGKCQTFAASPAEPGELPLWFSSTNAINATLYKNLNFNFITDIAPVASLYRNSPAVVVVNPSFPAKTLPEFIAYARANPGKINMAHSGVGSGPHAAGELFKAMAGV